MFTHTKNPKINEAIDLFSEALAKLTAQGAITIIDSLAMIEYLSRTMDERRHIWDHDK